MKTFLEMLGGITLIILGILCIPVILILSVKLITLVFGLIVTLIALAIPLAIFSLPFLVVIGIVMFLLDIVRISLVQLLPPIPISKDMFW